MSDEFGFQLFWLILLVTAFCLLLVGGGVFAKYAARAEYRRYLKLQAAKETWSKMNSKLSGPDIADLANKPDTSIWVRGKDGWIKFTRRVQ